MELKFRSLKANEIECRVQQCRQNGCILLLYKDARVDQRMLDEEVGPMYWRRSHDVIDGQLFCNVDIYNKEIKEWVRKQDVGTESNTEKEKGRASDSFKRACFNWGIGRELYTTPFMWINLNANEVRSSNGKHYLASNVKFSVKEINTNKDGYVDALTIVDNKGNERFKMGSFVKAPQSDNEEKTPTFKPNDTDIANLDLVKTEQDFFKFSEKYSKYKNDKAFRDWVIKKWEQVKGK